MGAANRKEAEIEVTGTSWSHCKTEAISSYARIQIPKCPTKVVIVRYICAAFLGVPARDEAIWV